MESNLSFIGDIIEISFGCWNEQVVIKAGYRQTALNKQFLTLYFSHKNQHFKTTNTYLYFPAR